MALPALYISHGSPRLIIEDSAARDFLKGLASTLPKPRAIVIATAHFSTSRPAVVGDAQPGMIYDFGGMPELRKLVYPAPGDPQVAITIARGFGRLLAKPCRKSRAAESSMISRGDPCEM